LGQGASLGNDNGLNPDNRLVLELQNGQQGQNQSNLGHNMMGSQNTSFQSVFGAGGNNQNVGHKPTFSELLL
jgi:hypothetical protein